MRVAAARLEMARDVRVQRVLAHGAVVIVEAPAGYGKSHLIDGLQAARPDAQVLWTRRDVELAATAGVGASLVLVDCDDPAPQAVAALAAAESTRCLVVADRVVRTELRAALDPYDCLELGAGDLGLSVDETAAAFRPAVAVDRGLAELIHAQSGGWPAVIAALARSATTGSLREAVAGGIVHHPAVNDFLRSTIDTWPAEIRDAIGRFATLDRVTVAALDDMSRRHLARDAVRVGVPLVVRDDGWIELPAVVRDHLGPPSVADCSAIAPHLARSGGLVPAVRALVGSGGYVAAGELLAEVRPEALDGADEVEVLGLLDVVERHVDSPRLGMLRVRALEHLGDPVAAAAAAEEVVRRSSPDSVEHVDARLELAWVAAMRGQAADTEGWSDRATTPEQQVRLDEIEAIQLSQRSSPDDVRAGAKGLGRAAARWEALGYNARASSALRVMAAVPLTHLGEYGQAIDAVQHARRLSWRRLFDRAGCTAFLARTAGLAGTIDVLDREAAAAMQLADSVSVPWLRLYVNWALILRAGLAGDAAGVAEAAIATERALDGLEAHSTATVLFAELAVAQAMVGQHDRAAEYLERALARRDDNPIEVDLAAQIVAARAGRVDEATRRAEALRADPAVPSTRLWRIDLEVALAIGDDAAVEQAVTAAGAVGSEDAARLIVDAVAPTDANVPRLRVSVMGELSVAVGGELVATPSGKPGDLLKLLATQPGPVSTGSLIDVMWPDADEETGLRRLKNPVNRLRAALGTANVIRRNGQVALAPAVAVDLREFETHSITAHARHDDETGVQAAISALNLYAAVLPGDELEAVATAALAAQSRAAGLVDLVMAAPPGDRPGSAWLLAAALRVDPYDDDRLIAIAEMARGEGNVACARRCITEVRRIAAVLDVPLSGRALRIEEELALIADDTTTSASIT